ncbi:hypothetical protein CCP4SC76_1640007 [Gammaproteobacteria bacterium]
MIAVIPSLSDYAATRDRARSLVRHYAIHINAPLELTTHAANTAALWVRAGHSVHRASHVAKNFMARQVGNQP